MNCSEFQEQVAALALHAVEPGERVELEAHLAGAGPHTGCHEAYARAVATVAELASALPPVQPTDRVWQSVEAKISGTAVPVPRRSSGREVIAWTLAAAALIAAVLAGREILQRTSRLEESQAAVARLQKELADARLLADGAARSESAIKEQLTQQAKLLAQGDGLRNDLLALLDAPGTEIVPFKPVAGAQVANAIVNARQKRAIVISKLPAESGKDYELWVIRGKGKPVPAGLMRLTPAGVAVGEIRQETLAQGLPDAFAVSIEQAGGVATPTKVLMVGSVKKKS